MGYQDRLEVIKKAEEYEKLGLFDRDLEADPPTRPLHPGECDYTGKKFSTRLQTKIANRFARAHFERKIRRGELVIDGVEGLENYRTAGEGGGVLTCNHFHPYDNYAIYHVLRPLLGKRDLYKVVREGNYTSFPGLYGYFFRHCNTLPIGSTVRTLHEFSAAAQTLLRRGERILIYPEQGMWWNYRKPRPPKPGAYQLAVRASVPVLPVFITMRDLKKKDEHGFPVQGYTLHFLPPVFPDPTLRPHDAEDAMAKKNFAAWRECYEHTYGTPLQYSTEGGVGFL